MPKGFCMSIAAIAVVSPLFLLHVLLVLLLSRAGL